MRTFVEVRSFRGPDHRSAAGLSAGVVVVATVARLLAAGPQAAAEQASLDQAGATTEPTRLAVLVAELRVNNPDVKAAQRAAEAATDVPKQVSSFPDPQITIQQFDVGKPLPFAGYSTSGFAYLAIGASQALPYPGTRTLRRDLARRDADVVEAGVDVVSDDQIEQLKTTYARLAYLQATLGILERDQALLQSIVEQAQARYASGQGNQQDLLRAELERTKILRELSVNRQATGEAQAALKRLVRRPQESADIVADPLAATPLRYTNAELAEKVRTENGEVRQRSAAVARNQAAVTLTQKEAHPDFGVSFMYQKTGPSFPDYYMTTFDVTFHRRAPQEAALAEARVNVDRADEERDSALQSALADLRRQYVIVQASEDQLRIYRDGLIPQAQASIQAALAAYQGNREDFQTVLSSFLEVQTLDLQYQQTLLDHETALAHIERLTGATLP